MLTSLDGRQDGGQVAAEGLQNGQVPAKLPRTTPILFHRHQMHLLQTINTRILEQKLAAPVSILVMAMIRTKAVSLAVSLTMCLMMTAGMWRVLHHWCP